MLSVSMKNRIWWQKPLFLFLLAFPDGRLNFEVITPRSGFPFKKANLKKSYFILTNVLTMIPTLENEILNMALLQGIKLRYENYPSLYSLLITAHNHVFYL